jgi:hypothetical protein
LNDDEVKTEAAELLRGLERDDFRSDHTRLG